MVMLLCFGFAFAQPFLDLCCGFWKFLDFLRDRPALDRAAATACFCGWPALIISRILEETVFLDLPDLRGMGAPCKAQLAVPYVGGV